MDRKLDPAEGQVTKIDESAGKITLRHGPIKKLKMDEGMTMVFKAQDLRGERSGHAQGCQGGRQRSNSMPIA
jgi:Cu/Ag efflux protein CusF